MAAEFLNVKVWVLGWVFWRGAFLTVWILYFVGWFPFTRPGSITEARIWYMASSQEENSSRKKLATETFTKPTFNYGIQVTLRNLGIYKKLLTVGAKAMHLNN